MRTLWQLAVAQRALHDAVQRNPSSSPEDVFNALRGRADPTLVAWMDMHHDMLLRAVADALNAMATPPVAATLPLAATPPPSADWTVEDAIARVVEMGEQLAALPPPEMIKDDVGFSGTTNRPMREYLAMVRERGAADVPLSTHLHAAVLLIQHSETQLPREDVMRAVSVLREAVRAAGLPEPPETGPGSRTIRDHRRGAAGNVTYRWLVDKGEVWLGLPYAANAIIDRSLKKYEHFRRKEDPPGSRQWWTIVPAKHAALMGETLGDNYPEVADVLQRFAVVWQTEYAASQAAPVPPESLDPRGGVVPGEGIRWKWSPDLARMVYLQTPQYFPVYGLGAVYKVLVAAGVRVAAEKKDDVFWLVFDVAELDKVRGVFRPYWPRTDRTLAVLAGLWKVGAPVLSEEESRKRRLEARALMRRFAHMMRPKAAPDDGSTVVYEEPNPTCPTWTSNPGSVGEVGNADYDEDALVEVMDLLRATKPGDRSGSVAAYGEWRIMQDRWGVHLWVYTGKALGEWGRDVPGFYLNKDAAGRWWRTFPLKHAPAVARALDAVSLPLAMSIRLGLLTDAMTTTCYELEELAGSLTVNDIADEKLREMVKQENARLPWPAGLYPYPYQQVGIVFAKMAGYRAILGDSPGLGKTVEAIGALLTDTARLLPALVVAPASVVYNWQRELQRWAPGMTSVVYDGGDVVVPARNGVVIVSWGILAKLIGIIQNRGFKSVILDEAHYAKHPGSQRSEAARALAHGVPHALLLSGTPMENRPIEVWHLLHMIDPQTFKSKTAFAEKFADAKKRVVTRKRTDPTTGAETVTTEEFIDDRGASNLDELRTLLRCQMIRRLKTDVLTELPGKTRVPIWLRLPDAAMAAYRRAEAEMPAWICRAWVARTARRIAQDYQRVEKEGSASPEMIPDAVSAANAEPPDISALASLAIVQMGYLRRLAGEAKVPQAIEWLGDYLESADSPVLIWHEHRNVGEAVRIALSRMRMDARPLRWTFIDGSVTGKDRTERVAAFQDGQYDVMVLSQAGREGITLTRATSAVFLERWLVPAREEQAEDRIHRISQVHPVTIYQLMAEDTMDERIALLCEKKRKIVKTVLGEERVEEVSEEADIEGSISADLANSFAVRVLAEILEGRLACRVTVRDVEAALTALRAGDVEAAQEGDLENREEDRT